MSCVRELLKRKEFCSSGSDLVSVQQTGWRQTSGADRQSSPAWGTAGRVSVAWPGSVNLQGWLRIFACRGRLHLESPHQTVQIGYVDTQPARRLAVVSTSDFQRLGDNLLFGVAQCRVIGE